MGDAPGAAIVETALDGPTGVRFSPAAGAATGVLVLAGSSGRIDLQRARLIAETGAVAESVQWFAGPGQPVGPTEIPLELFAARIEALRRETDRQVIVGTSFGAEAALATAALACRVDAVVAFAPSDVVWAGVRPDGSQTSHWSLDGRALAFVPLDQQWAPSTDPPEYRGLYQASRRKAPDAAEAACIPVERLPELVLVVGGDDRVWPSDEHAEAIQLRRRRAGLDTQIASAARAGHRAILPGEEPVTAGVRMARGGTPHADSELGRQAAEAMRRLIGGSPA